MVHRPLGVPRGLRPNTSGGYLSAGRMKWDRGRFLRSFLKIHFHRFDSHASLLACGLSGSQTQRTRFVGYTVTP